MSQPKVPDWAKSFVLGQIELVIDGNTYTCHLMNPVYQRKLFGFAGFLGEFLYASMDIRGEFLRYVLAFEVRKAKMTGREKCLACLKLELEDVPYYLKKEYLAFRIRQLRDAAVFYEGVAPSPETEDLRCEITTCLTYLEHVPGHSTHSTQP